MIMATTLSNLSGRRNSPWHYMLSVGAPLIVVPGLLWLFWRPWFVSSEVPADRLASILSAVGQVLFTFIVAVVAALSAVNETALRRLRELVSERDRLVQKEGEPGLLAKFSRALEGLIAEMPFNENISDRVFSLLNVEPLDSAQKQVDQVRMAKDLLPTDVGGDAKKKRDVCISLLSEIETIRWLPVLKYDQEDLERKFSRLQLICASLLSFSFIDCLVCFWPDTLFAQALGHDSRGHALPTGVAALTITMILCGIFLGIFLFLQGLVSVHRSSVRPSLKA
jgi:uncharacterized membrane protein (DUF485 family)